MQKKMKPKSNQVPEFYSEKKRRKEYSLIELSSSSWIKIFGCFFINKSLTIWKFVLVDRPEYLVLRNKFSHFVDITNGQHYCQWRQSMLSILSILPSSNEMIQFTYNNHHHHWFTPSQKKKHLNVIFSLVFLWSMFKR